MDVFLSYLQRIGARTSNADVVRTVSEQVRVDEVVYAVVTS